MDLTLNATLKIRPGAAALAESPDPTKDRLPDLRKTGSHPDYWYPVARSKTLKRGKTLLESVIEALLKDLCHRQPVELDPVVVVGPGGSRGFPSRVAADHIR